MVLAALAAGLGLVAGGAHAQPSKTPDVTDTSFVTADGARNLRQSAVIAAPVSRLWRAFVDPVEFKRWNAPVMAIDLRVGGMLEAAYDTSRPLGDPDNIKNRIITFIPERLLVLQNVQAPHDLPHADLFQRIVTVVEYEPLGPDKTRVTISCTGWATDPDSARLYAFFERDDAMLLEKMKAIYEAPPTP